MNSRDLKFRAYDKTNKVMVYSDKHNEDEYEDVIYYFEVVDCIFVCTHDFAFGDDIVADISDVMECTGFHDKYGIEIYEGDIIEYTDISGKNINKIGVIEMINGCWYFNGNVRFSKSLELATVHWKLFDLATYRDIAIIGNIYETKEYLSEREI